MAKGSKSSRMDWLKEMREPPTYYPTEEQFADPVAFIRSIQAEAEAYGICRVVPPFPAASTDEVKKRLNAALLALSKNEYTNSKNCKDSTPGAFSEESLTSLKNSKSSSSLLNLQSSMGLGIMEPKSNLNIGMDLSTETKSVSMDLAREESISTQNMPNSSNSNVKSMDKFSGYHFSDYNSNLEVSQHGGEIFKDDKSDSRFEPKGSFTTLELKLGGPAVKNEGMRSTQKLAARRQRPSKRWYSIDEFEAKASAFFKHKFGEAKSGKTISDFEIEKSFWDSTSAIKACLVECSADISSSLFPPYRSCCVLHKKSNLEKSYAPASKAKGSSILTSALHLKEEFESNSLLCNERVSGGETRNEMLGGDPVNGHHSEARFDNTNDLSYPNSISRQKSKFGPLVTERSHDQENVNEPELISKDQMIIEQNSFISNQSNTNDEFLLPSSSGNDKLAKSAWNLCHVSHAEGSLLNHVNDLPISEMAAPRVKIGMLFSWFGWFTDGYQFYSVNYMHFGSPATWYAVPGKYAECMEETVREQIYNSSLSSNAVAKQLSRGITLMHPQHLVNDDVPCYRVIQNQGDFIVTFPGTYRLILNHGFNCIESSNLACAESLILPRGISSWNRGLQWAAEVSHEITLLRSVLSISRNITLHQYSSHGNDLIIKLFHQQMRQLRKLLLKLSSHGAICVIDLENGIPFYDVFSDEINSQTSLRSSQWSKQKAVNTPHPEAKSKAVIKMQSNSNLCDQKNIHSSFLQDYQLISSTVVEKTSQSKNYFVSNLDTEHFETETNSTEMSNFPSSNHHSFFESSISESPSSLSLTKSKALLNPIQFQIQIQSEPGVTRLFLSDSSKSRVTKSSQNYDIVRNWISELKFKILSQESPVSSIPYVTCAVCGVRCCSAFALVEPLHSENIRKASLNTKTYTYSYSSSTPPTSAMNKFNNLSYMSFLNNRPILPNPNSRIDGFISKGGNPHLFVSSPLPFPSEYQDFTVGSTQKSSLFSNALSHIPLDPLLRKSTGFDTAYAPPSFNLNPASTSQMFHPSPSPNHPSLELKSNGPSHKVPPPNTHSISLLNSNPHDSLSSFSNGPIPSSPLTFASTSSPTSSRSPSFSNLSRRGSFENNSIYSNQISFPRTLEEERMSPNQRSISIWSTEDKGKASLEINQVQNHGFPMFTPRSDDGRLYTDTDEKKTFKDVQGKGGQSWFSNHGIHTPLQSKQNVIETAHLHALNQIHQDQLQNPTIYQQHQHQLQQNHLRQMQLESNSSSPAQQPFFPSMIRMPLLPLQQKFYSGQQQQPQQLHLSRSSLTHLPKDAEPHLPFHHPNDEKSLLLLNYLTKDNSQCKGSRNQNVRKTRFNSADGLNRDQSQHPINYSYDLQKNVVQGIDLNTNAESEIHGNNLISSSGYDEKSNVSSKRVVLEFDLNQDASTSVSANTLAIASASTLESDKVLIDLNESVAEMDIIHGQKHLDKPKPKGFDLNVSVFEKDSTSVLSQYDRVSFKPNECVVSPIKRDRVYLSSVPSFPSPSPSTSNWASYNPSHPSLTSSSTFSPRSNQNSNQGEKNPSLQDKGGIPNTFVCSRSEKDLISNGHLSKMHMQNPNSRGINFGNFPLDESVFGKEISSVHETHITSSSSPSFHKDYNLMYRRNELQDDDDDDDDNNDKDLISRVSTIAKPLSFSETSYTTKEENMNEKRSISEKLNILLSKSEDAFSLERQMKKPTQDSMNVNETGTQTLSKSMSISALEKMIKVSSQLPKPNKFSHKFPSKASDTPSTTETPIQPNLSSKSIRCDSDLQNDSTPRKQCLPIKQDSTPAEKSKKDEVEKPESKKDTKKEMESLKLDRILVKSYSRGLVQNMALGEGSRVLCLQHANMAQRHFEDMYGSNVIVMCHEDLPLLLQLSEVLKTQHLIDENYSDEEYEEEEEEEEEEEDEEDEDEDVQKEEKEEEKENEGEQEKVAEEGEFGTEGRVVGEEIDHGIAQGRKRGKKRRKNEKEKLILESKSSCEQDYDADEIGTLESKDDDLVVKFGKEEGEEGKGIEKAQETENRKMFGRLFSNDSGLNVRNSSNSLNEVLKLIKRKGRVEDTPENKIGERKYNGGIKQETENENGKKTDVEEANGKSDDREGKSVESTEKNKKLLTGMLELRHITKDELDVIRNQISFLENRKAGNVSSSDWINLFDFRTLREKKQAVEEEERRKRMEKEKASRGSTSSLPSSPSLSPYPFDAENEGGMDGGEEKVGERKSDRGGKDKKDNGGKEKHVSAKKREDLNRNPFQKEEKEKEKAKEKAETGEKDSARKNRGQAKKDDESKSKRRKKNDGDAIGKDEKKRKEKERLTTEDAEMGNRNELDGEKETENDRRRRKGSRGRRPKSLEGRDENREEEKEEGGNDEEKLNDSPLQIRKPVIIRKKRRIMHDIDSSTIADSLISLSTRVKDRRPRKVHTKKVLDSNATTDTIHHNQKDKKDSRTVRAPKPNHHHQRHLQSSNGQNEYHPDGDQAHDPDLAPIPIQKLDKSRSQSPLRFKVEKIAEKDKRDQEYEKPGEHGVQNSNCSFSSSPSHPTPLSPLRFLSYAATCMPTSLASLSPHVPSPSISSLEKDEFDAVAALMSVRMVGERSHGYEDCEVQDSKAREISDNAVNALQSDLEASTDIGAKKIDKSNYNSDNHHPVSRNRMSLQEDSIENVSMKALMRKKKGLGRMDDKIVSPSEVKKKAKFDVTSSGVKKKNGILNFSKNSVRTSPIMNNPHAMDSEDEANKKRPIANGEENGVVKSNDRVNDDSGGNHGGASELKERKWNGREGRNEKGTENVKLEVTRKRREKRERVVAKKERLDRICKILGVGSEGSREIGNE